MTYFIEMNRPGNHYYAYSKELTEDTVKDVQITLSTENGKKTTLTVDFEKETVKSSSRWVKVDAAQFVERDF